ncbi:MAG: hypothetical protein IJ283_03905 [Oscillospiraceae bacterium]|nr:hypothetical protein [Oscillospiraceae bacterium]
MLYSIFTVNGEDYRLRLDCKYCVELEKKLGTNPLNVFTKIGQTGEIPQLDVLITILHCSLQHFHHNMTMDKTYELYDKFVDDGNTLMELVPVLMEVFKVSGFFKDNKEEEIENPQM